MVFQSGAPAPVQSPITRPPRYKDRPDPLAWLLPQVWIDWFTNLIQGVEQASSAVVSLPLSQQSASVGATDFSGGNLPGGVYEIKYSAGIRRAAGTSSSLTIALDWVTNGVTRSYTGAAMIGNLTSDYQEKSLFVRIDGGTPVRYTVTYVSVGAPSMQYDLDLVLTRISS